MENNNHITSHFPFNKCHCNTKPIGGTTMSLEERIVELNSAIYYLTEEIVKLNNSQGGVLQQYSLNDPSTELIEEVAKPALVEPEEAPEPEKKELKVVITADQAREALKDYVLLTKSRLKGKALLESLGAKTFGKVDPKDYHIILNALETVKD